MILKFDRVVGSLTPLRFFQGGLVYAEVRDTLEDICFVEIDDPESITGSRGEVCYLRSNSRGLDESAQDIGHYS